MKGISQVERASCELFIGQGAGKKLMREMHKAEASIYIVTSEISEDLIDSLLLISKQNVHIQLYTMGSNTLYNGIDDNWVRKLVVQHREIDEGASKQRKHWRSWQRYLLLVNICIAIGLGIGWWYFKDNIILYGYSITGLLLGIQSVLQWKIAKKVLYSYRYSTKFPFTIYFMDEKHFSPHIQIHSNIYLIDDKILYLGSMSLTKNGMGMQHECRVRSEDKTSIIAAKKSIEAIAKEMPNRCFDLNTYVAKNYT
ncbi:MAG: phospholipase D-like domain-containing protein, partial [Flavobacteriaceae bacterium]|nr:phospholipase D-like domain-containing protein [Flavobacteriaceae bacterium]